MGYLLWRNWLIAHTKHFCAQDFSETCLNWHGNSLRSVSKADEDAVSALINLGYARAEAYKAVMTAKSKANDNERDEIESLIRLALLELSA